MNFRPNKLVYHFVYTLDILKIIFIFSTDFFFTKMVKILHLIQGNLLSTLFHLIYLYSTSVSKDEHCIKPFSLEQSKSSLYPKSDYAVDYANSLVSCSAHICSDFCCSWTASQVSNQEHSKSDRCWRIGHLQAFSFRGKLFSLVNIVLSFFNFLQVSMYKMLPLRTLSRLWGWINSINLPTVLRTPVLKSYANTFGCNLEEADIDDLKQYRNLGEFFRRSLKPGVRPIQGSESDVVSPSDGTILHLGSAKEGFLEQVKGITYTIESFLGPNTWSSREKDTSADNLDYQKSLLHQSTSSATDLYYCTVYLAPGDYHKFHSPTNWTVNFRRHFPGKLYSVRPAFVSWFPNVFSVNERVAYVGSWKYGFFSMAPVGATNVGSMKIYFDNVCFYLILTLMLTF